MQLNYIVQWLVCYTWSYHKNHTDEPINTILNCRNLIDYVFYTNMVAHHRERTIHKHSEFPDIRTYIFVA